MFASKPVSTRSTYSPRVRPLRQPRGQIGFKGEADVAVEDTTDGGPYFVAMQHDQQFSTKDFQPFKRLIEKDTLIRWFGYATHVQGQAWIILAIKVAELGEIISRPLDRIFLGDGDSGVDTTGEAVGNPHLDGRFRGRL